MIRQLSLHINPEKIYRALASILQDQQVRFRNPGTFRLALSLLTACVHTITFLCTGPRVRVRDDSNAQRHPPHFYRALRSQVGPTPLHLFSPLLTLSPPPFQSCVRRLHLKDLSTPESRELFIILYRSWCNNAVATFSLCLLSQAYEHATHLIAKLYALPLPSLRLC